MSVDLQLLQNSTWDTVYMVFVASALSILLGLMVGLALYVAASKKSATAQILYRILSFVVNIGRSIPFVILMIALIPITRFLIGTSIGTTASIVPLTIAAIPFYARIAESAFKQVPAGLLEAAKAMGLSAGQSIWKVILPESKIALLEGVTLTVISLIAYSAVVGIVGGGGLGDVAIRYGYQRFDVEMMLLIIVILVVLVQCVQAWGDWSSKKRSWKGWGLLSIVLCLGCGWHLYTQAAVTRGPVLRVGIVSGPMQQVMAVAQQVAQQDGLQIKVVVFDDYVLPNQALNSGELDANIFQHQPYLDAQTKAHHYHLSALAKTFVYPMGFYSIKIKNLNELPEGAIVAIPNDPSNEGRALLLLQKAGLIQLKASAGLFATPQDIISNPKHLQFKELDAADVPRALQDVSMGAITNDYIGAAHLTVNQALIHEGPDVPYANIIVVRTNDLKNPQLQTLVQVMHSPQVVQETEKLFPDGAAIPAW